MFNYYLPIIDILFVLRFRQLRIIESISPHFSSKKPTILVCTASEGFGNWIFLNSLHLVVQNRKQFRVPTDRIPLEIVLIKERNCNT